MESARSSEKVDFLHLELKHYNALSMPVIRHQGILFLGRIHHVFYLSSQQLGPDS